MGWFGKGIMDGDPALDWAGTLCDIIGVLDVEKIYKPSPEVRGALETRQHMLKKRVEREVDSDERNIGWQVLAVMIMQQGAAMSDTVRANCMAALENDEWAMSDMERRIYANDMIAILEAYDGKTPTDYRKDWSKEYGIGEEDVNAGAKSWKMLNAAMCQLAEHLKNKPWFNGIRFAVNGAGYRMLLVVSENSISESKGAILSDKDVPAQLFDIPVSFYVEGQVTIMKTGESIGE